MEQQLETITWQELKDFCNSIPNEFLGNKANVLISDNNQGTKLNEPYFLEEDVWCHKEGFADEDAAHLEDLKATDDNFDIDNYEVITKKGNPFLWIDEV